VHGEDRFDAVVVGAGFAGLYLLHRLREAGLRTRVLEAAGGVGGTWWWNRYPGARCDVESVEYSYQFSEELQQEWEWSERYAAQPEILRYLDHVADRFDLRRDIELDTRVAGAAFDEGSDTWTVRTAAGATLTTRFLVMATGCLSAANVPDIPGRDTFAGEMLHTGRWPHGGVSFSGRRVGVIGTGSSAVQAVPVIAREADHLVVFQRTPSWSVPARNGPLDPEEQRAVKAGYAELRARNRQMSAAFGARIPPPVGPALTVAAAERERVLEERWERGGFGFLSAFTDLLLDREANATAAAFVRAKIRELVHDPEVAERLSPDHVLGCKRLCLDSGWFETFNRPDVRLVDLREAPIEAITPAGIRAGGEEHELDAIVFATGFDAMTGALLQVDLRGREGRRLGDAWWAGPRTYLGLGVPGFPNLFLVNGPGSPSVLTNMVVSIEHHVEWITDCISHLREHGRTRIEADGEAAERWVEHVNAVADATLFPTCSSWYLGANVPGKPRVFMPLPGFPAYVAECERVAAAGYEGFALGRAPAGAAS
jgi:cation diffusion facilitator CzcD-associated flavoprotein CzcO